MKKILFISSTIVLFTTLIFVIIVYFCNGCCWASVFDSSFGMLNAIFSGLAFAGVIATLIWQKLDSDKKSFESNLYKQIEFFLQLVENLSYKNSDGADPYEGKGRDIFKWFYDDKRYFVDGINDLQGVKAKLKDNPHYLYSEGNVKIFESYFNYLFNLYDYIDKSSSEENVKFEYANQVTALLTRYELYIIYYYVISLEEHMDKRKYDKMKELCVKYHIFQNLDTAYLADIKHIDLMDKQAFLK